MTPDLLMSRFEGWELRHFKNKDEVKLKKWQLSSGIVYIDEVPSTKALVQSWDSDQVLPERECLVVTPAQTAGQGRQSRSWFAAPASSLTFNYICRVESWYQPGHLSLLAAWAQWKVFTGLYGIEEVDLKWPNDVLIKNRKCSGSLMEIKKIGVQPMLSLGLGINVGAMTFPDELSATAISLNEVCVLSLTRTEVLHDVLMCFKEGLNLLKEPAWLIEQYSLASSYVKGASLQFLDQGQVCEGLSSGLSDSGGLWILDSNGQKREWHGSEIEKVRRR